tara:strand:+ start:200 stop:418 length:219 start_codon:yes stop_codon:yes gene_type:complete
MKNKPKLVQIWYLYDDGSREHDNNCKPISLIDTNSPQYIFVLRLGLALGLGLTLALGITLTLGLEGLPTLVP